MQEKTSTRPSLASSFALALTIVVGMTIVDNITVLRQAVVFVGPDREPDIWHLVSRLVLTLPVLTFIIHATRPRK